MGHKTPAKASGVLGKAEKFLCASYVLLFYFSVPDVIFTFPHSSVSVSAHE